MTGHIARDPGILERLGTFKSETLEGTSLWAV